MRLLIVEDESIIRNGLMKHLPWEQLGIRQLKSAANAREALRIFDSFQPEIVLTDIIMPGLNGIDMCREMKKQYPDFQIIFLTGYVEKEYLKGAIDLQAVGYVEKPLDVHELQKVIRVAVEEVSKERIRKETILHRILMDREVAQDYMGTLPESRVCLVYMQKRADAALLRKILEKTDVFGRKNRGVMLYDYVSPRMIAILLGRTLDCPCKETSAPELYDLLKRESWSGGWFLAWGKEASGVEEIAESYSTAKDALKALSWMGWNQRAFYPQGASEYRRQNTDTSDIEQFRGFVEEMKPKEAMNWLDEFNSRLHGEQVALNYPVYHIMYELLQAIQQRNHYFRNDEREIEVGAAQEVVLEQAETLDELIFILKREVRKRFSADREEQKENQKSCFLIQKVTDYIRENYQDPELSIKVLADYVYLTPTYLSNLFKRHMNITIGQYLTDLRICEAKKKLRDPKYKMYQISELVGYKDPNYFAKIFKKKTGCTPSEYRERGER